jgi:outer membrane lipoprotein carrier protein
MQLHLNRVISLVLILCFSILYATDKSVIQDLAKKYYNSNTFTADIMQTNEYKAQNKKLTSQGKFYKQSNLFLLEFSKPYYQFIHFNDNEILLHDSSINTTHIINNKNFKTFNPDSFFYELSQGNFTLRDNNSFYQVRVKISENTIMDFSIRISKNNELIESISYKDNMGNPVSLVFSNQKFNVKISKNLQNFKIPKNSKVINL